VTVKALDLKQSDPKIIDSYQEIDLTPGWWRNGLTDNWKTGESCTSWGLETWSHRLHAADFCLVRATFSDKFGDSSGF